MPLKLYDALDAVPETLRESALETKDGKFAVDEGDEGGKTALQEERTKREAAERLAAKTAAELKKLETKNKANESGVTAEKLAEIEAQVAARLEEQYKPIVERDEANTKTIRELQLDTQVKALAGKCGVIGAELPRWWKLHGDSFDLTSDGKPVVKGKEGVSLEKFIGEDLKKDTPYLYEGSKADGGGAGGITKGGGTVTTSAEDILTNPSAALQAARASGKTE